MVLLYDNLRHDPKSFINKLARLLNAKIDIDSIDFSKKHSSYSEKQLKIIRSISKTIDLTKRRKHTSGVLHFFWRLALGLIRYSILFLARLIPSGMMDSSPLIDPTELEKVQLYFAGDWEAIKKISS